MIGSMKLTFYTKQNRAQNGNASDFTNKKNSFENQVQYNFIHYKFLLYFHLSL